MCCNLCAWILCLCASMFACLCLIALMWCLKTLIWYSYAVSQAHARTHTHIPLSLDSVRCQKLGAHLTLSDPLPTFRLFSTQLLHSVDHTRAPDTHFLNHLGNFPGCYPSSFCQDSQCPSVHTTALCVFVCMWKRSVEYTAPYLNI